ncbi:MAG: acetate--CoA ligase family protein [Acidobacteriia bacterium]|nr:acetate--CoA ligase family protein [Terriglobia bacterium]
METTAEQSLDVLFRGEGIAILGASTKKGKPGYQIVENTKDAGFAGNIYPVNLTADSILGFKCYKSLEEIQGRVDIVVMVLASNDCVEAAKAIARRKDEKGDVAAVIVVSAGFSELGTDQGRSREKALLDQLVPRGIRVVGPNCLGIIDTYHGISTNFDIGHYRKGGLSIITQSGAFACSYLKWATPGSLVGLNKFASLGNMSDVDVVDLLKYFGEDERTHVIALYLEGTRQGRALIEVAAEVSKKKPVVALKAGKTKVGSTAVASHTGSIAGNFETYQGVFRQAGVVLTPSVCEFYHTAAAFDKMPLPKGNRICILTVLGGPAALCIDELIASGAVDLAKLSEETKSKLREILIPAANIGKPEGLIDTTPSFTEEQHYEVFKIILRDPGVDGVIYLNTPPIFIDEKALAKNIVEAYQSFPQEERKPVISVIGFGYSVPKLRKTMEEAGMPTIEYPDIAAKVMINMVRYSQYKSRFSKQKVSVLAPETIPTEKAETYYQEIVKKTLTAGRKLLPEHEAYEICKAFNIPYPPTQIAKDWKEVEKASKKFGFPVVLKIVSPQVVHKSDVGGVIVGITTPGDLKRAYDQLLANVKEKAGDVVIDGVLVQKAMRKGVEVAIGGLKDEVFGPMIMFGSGGILIEVFKDVAFRMAPLDQEEALLQIKDTKAYEMLKGIRGALPSDLKALTKLIVNASNLIYKVPELAELDFNPVLAYPDGCVVVDARMVLK